VPHEHLIVDDDARFWVDTDTKALVDSEPNKRTIVQYDHNSERYTFEIPRYIEGHDMSLCNVVEFHFTNIDKTTKEEADGFLPLTDLHVSAENENKVICSCTIDKICTQHVGPLHFSIRYACEEPDGTVVYEYNTRKYTRISIVDGMGNREEVDAIKAQIAAYIDREGYEKTPATYILVDEDGIEVPAVLVDEPVELTATPNDIRVGITAVTAEGVTTGEKEIPAYHTEQGYQVVKPGKALDILMYSDQCQYTKLQAIVCAYHETVDASVGAEMVVINDKLYPAGSTEALADVSVDADNQSIKLGLVNNSETSLLIRYMTIKEEP
jgi:hypothetical protein